MHQFNYTIVTNPYRIINKFLFNHSIQLLINIIRILRIMNHTKRYRHISSIFIRNHYISPPRLHPNINMLPSPTKYLPYHIIKHLKSPHRLYVYVISITCIIFSTHHSITNSTELSQYHTSWIIYPKPQSQTTAMEWLKLLLLEWSLFEKLLLLLLLSAFSRGGETLPVEAEFPRLTSLVGFEGQGPVILGEHIMAEYRKSGVMNFRRFFCVQMIVRIICGFV